MKESLHYLLMSNHLMFHKALITAIRDTELSSGQPKVLDYLRNHNGAIQKDIASACHIEPATLTSVLLGMENKNMITRKMIGGNRRNLYVYLTDKGQELAGRVQSEFDVIEKNALSEFTDEEKETLTALLLRISKNINDKEDIFNE